MKGRVCGLQLLLALANTVILGYESRGAHDHILLSQIRDPPPPQPGGPGHRIYIPQKRGGQVITLGTGFLLVASYYGGGIRTRLHGGHCRTVRVRIKVRVTLRLAIYRQSVHLSAEPLETHKYLFSTEHLQL
jgi:hypothetical protein